MALIKIKDYEVSPTDSYIFDTNIWLLLFGPVAGSRKREQQMYAQLFQDIQARRATIFITSLILSEYINAALRMNFRWWMAEQEYKNADFKHDYRSTPHYKEALKDVKEQVKDILNCTTKRNDDFQDISFISTHSLLDNDCDYNDAYLLRYCSRNHFHIVTDDGDITKQDIPIKIVTA